MLVFALIAITNLGIGFALAIWLGQGPRPWYALFLPSKQSSGLIEIAPLKDSGSPPSRRQPEEEEHVVVSLMEIPTEDLARQTPPPKPGPVAATATDEEDEAFDTELTSNLATKDVAENTQSPAQSRVDEDAVESMSFHELLDQTQSPCEAADDQEDGETLEGSDIDALFADAGKR